MLDKHHCKLQLLFLERGKIEI